MQFLEEDPFQALQKSSKTYEMTFIHSPFCGTCHIARKMLETLEAAKEELTLNELNASVHPTFMQHFQIESVPCLLITNGMDVEEKVYAFHSVPHMYDKISEYEDL